MTLFFFIYDTTFQNMKS